MKRKLAIMTSLGLAAGLVSGCGGDHSQASAGGGGGGGGSMTPSSVALSTGDVLTLAQKTSESAAPYAVDGGALVLSDTSETAEPINVNAM
jgi:uncharacterized spore protein YtfJ